LVLARLGGTLGTVVSRCANFERLDDAMQKGYELKDTEAGCDLWIEVWRTF